MSALHLLTLSRATVRLHRIRVGVSLSSIVVAFILFGALETMRVQLYRPTANADLLQVIPGTGPLPYAYAAEIAHIPHVTATMASLSVPIDSPSDLNKQEVVTGVDPKPFAEIFRHLDLGRSVIKDWLNVKTSALCDSDTAALYGWKVKDHIAFTLTGVAPPNNVAQVDLVGIYDSRSLISGLVMHYDYLSSYNRDSLMSSVYVTVDDERRSTLVARQIDDHFKTSAAITITAPVNNYLRIYSSESYAIRWIIIFILSVAFFTALLITANSSAQIMRDRLPQFALLQVLGFSMTSLLWLVAVETLALFAVGMLIGLVAAQLALSLHVYSVGERLLPTHTLVLALPILLLGTLVTSFLLSLQILSLDTPSRIRNL